jgi:hypothetical protein
MILIDMKKKIIFTLIFFGLAGSVLGQQKDTWTKWTWLIGEWAGEGTRQ